MDARKVLERHPQSFKLCFLKTVNRHLFNNFARAGDVCIDACTHSLVKYRTQGVYDGLSLRFLERRAGGAYTGHEAADIFGKALTSISFIIDRLSIRRTR
eukprot:XP_001705256.1 Hypothetical protein GL50803_31409 [Giardia lamblia ATCC 50803]